jgi:hypothetical protein
MSKRLDLEALKKEYVGKRINWLTILDVFHSTERRLIMFRCQCKCGRTAEVCKYGLLNNRIVSCGCYRHSVERGAKYAEWCKNNPDKVKEKIATRSKTLKENPNIIADSIKKRNELYKEHPELLKDIGKKISQWYKNNPDKVKQLSENRIQYLSDDRVRQNLSKKTRDIHKNNRVECDFSKLLDVLHPKYKDDLLSGKLDSLSQIETKCPICGNYDSHRLNTVYVFSRSDFRRSQLPPLCAKCSKLKLVSKYEQEIADYISTFYNGKLVKNDRSALNGKELDLYYPEKKIAIEFNGDYWHDENHQSRDYHYNKYIDCRDLNITLVSIFESDWNRRKKDIKESISDLFSGRENKLSFNEDHTLVNNNYPLPLYKYNVSDNFIEHYYTTRQSKVYTCGYSTIISDIKLK